MDEWIVAKAREHHRDACLDNHDEANCFAIQTALQWENWDRARSEIIDLLRGVANQGREFAYASWSISQLNEFRSRAVSILGMIDT